MSQDFSQTGGARVGRSYWIASNATWPFASLQATPQTLTLTVLMKPYTFERKDIRQLKQCRGILFAGLQIVHLRKDYPPFVVFWTFNFDLLKSELQKLGFSVEDNGS
jgi:hypothetical protein